MTITALRRQVEQSILASAGVPTSSLGGADAGASREQYRQFARLRNCQPVLDGVAAQIGAHFETELTVRPKRLVRQRPIRKRLVRSSRWSRVGST